MGFAAVVEAATRAEMTDKALKQRVATIYQDSRSIKGSGKGTINIRDNKKPRNEGNNSINHEYKSVTATCHHCGRKGYTFTKCYRKLRLCF